KVAHAQLALARRLLSRTKREFDQPHVLHHFAEMRWLERGEMIGAGKRAIERQVLFDDRSAEGYGGQRNLTALGMVRIANREAERLAQRKHRSQVDVLRSRRVDRKSTRLNSSH